uniref:Uncharacterized protein n=1 Tax=Nelumbo nucifera TaxID=4432 RepID=A0A822Z5S0_NELNU|nr:TPA_asm: hypothetical protein HUJ06_014745 [Nelumbo nucifera]
MSLSNNSHAIQILARISKFFRHQKFALWLSKHFL